jgi:hypothetical protein
MMSRFKDFKIWQPYLYKYVYVYIFSIDYVDHNKNNRM